MSESKRLWQKDGAQIHPAVNKYMISKSLDADNKLLPFDVQGSKAHAKMLGKIGLLDKKDIETIVQTLDEILSKHQSGEFVLRPENEDVHTEIENYLVEKLGDIGKRVHVGRSRNDQVLTDMRLFTRAELKRTQSQIKTTAQALLDFAQKYEFTPLPGYTHMQHAMPSSFGQWAGAFVESLINDHHVLDSALMLNDQNPLGSGSGFGSAVPLDRQATTKELGFDRVQINPIYCQNSRGKIEAFTIATLAQVMMTLGKLANDLVIFYSQEFSFIKIDPSMTTGSSMMPQKRNLDIMEVLRANVHVIQSLQHQCESVGLNLISGYNKDLKITKKPLMDAFDITLSSLSIVELLIGHVEPNDDGVAKAFEDKEIFATDAANKLVMEGMSFRDAYRQVGENLDQLKNEDAVENIKSKPHIGATGNLRLDDYGRQLSKLR